jgi:hypothetical protein
MKKRFKPHDNKKIPIAETPAARSADFFCRSCMT